MPKVRCAFPNCKCKIRTIDELIATCRCGKTYCKNHRLPEMHSCTFCYEINKEKFIKDNLCISSKINVE